MNNTAYWCRGVALAGLAGVSLCACASAGEKPAEPDVVTLDEDETDAEKQGDPVCRSDAFRGTWLLESGTATLSCGGRANSAIAAGGTIEVLADAGTDDALVMMDGPCRYSFQKDGCALKGPSGVTCVQDGVSYTVEELTLEGGLSGLVGMTYRLSGVDKTKGGKCSDETRARLVRGEPEGQRCQLGGRWTRETNAWREPAEVVLEVDQGKCSLSSPGYTGLSRCNLKGNLLTLTTTTTTDADPGCGAGRKATYNVFFASGCQGLMLETASEPCTSRKMSMEYLYLHR